MNLITNLDVLRDALDVTLGNTDHLNILPDAQLEMMPDIADVEVWWNEEYDESFDYYVLRLEFKQGCGKNATIATLPGKYYGRQLDVLGETLKQYSEEASERNWEEWKEYNA